MPFVDLPWLILPTAVPNDTTLSLLSALVGKVSAMTVIQEPPFASFSQGKELTFNCSHSESGSYHFFWYRQQPGKIELQVLGNLYFFDNKLTEIDTSLETPISKLYFLHSQHYCRISNLSLRHARIIHTYTKSNNIFTWLYIFNKYSSIPVGIPNSGIPVGTAKCVLSIPKTVTSSNSITLVCLAHGFSYAWPLDVIWKRDGQAVPRFSAATEEPKAEGKCSFGIASRLSIATSEWKEGHTYSCHVHSTCRIPILPSVEELQRWRH
uniref:Ig-like domain-containing protein n=1 Tax=Anolis carolinensis TaxID=28377 RepID=A0A803T6M9_ANOCA